jgi:hypothetical protein
MGLGLLLAVIVGLFVSVLGPVPAAHADDVDDEWSFVRLVNQARADNGLAPLTPYAPIRDVARGQSIRMGQQSRLYHNPNLQADIQAAAPDWQRAGENVGQGWDVQGLHDAFMNSPGHRANVLGDYNYVGIGVVHAGGYTWVTEVFLKAPGGKPALQAVVPAPPPPPPPPVPVDRIAGASATETAVAVASRFASGSADAVVVGRNDVFADALAGGPLAAVNHGPVLLTSPSSPSPGVVAEAARVLRPDGTVYLLGGPAAVSPSVEAAFVAAGLQVQRVFGADRYDTAVEVARRVSLLPPSDVLIVSGTNFADAMVAGPVAGRLSSPVLLSSPTGLSPSTRAYLAVVPTTRRVVIGGVAAVGEVAASQAGTSDRVAGADRYETSVRVAQRWMGDASALSFATGSSFQDALAGAPWSAHESMPLVLLSPSPSTVVRSYVKSTLGNLSSSTVYGGTQSLSDTAVALAFL